MIRKLLSLPPNLVSAFHDLEKVNPEEWFCTSDPEGMKLGSGGGTAWVMQNAPKTTDKRIIIHAGGQSRRLPSYAPSGKILTPVPVFRWARGQRLGQNLLSLQLPLYEKIMERAPEKLRTLIASGDVYIRATQRLQEIPDVDVVCYGLWVDATLATRHGVFVSDRRQPEALDFMLQKPSLEELANLSKTHLFLMDIGVWLLSDRALDLLMKKSLSPVGTHSDASYGRTNREGGSKSELRLLSPDKRDCPPPTNGGARRGCLEGVDQGASLHYYDLYGEYGLALGNRPRIADEELNSLSVAILPLPGGEFYHFGTSRELLSSTVALQNKVYDQRQIMHRKLKPNPAIFVQNAEVHVPFSAKNDNLWIENSYVGAGWRLGARQIITGVPRNDWTLTVPDGICIDIVPLAEKRWAVRPYAFDDTFEGTKQTEPLFPVVEDVVQMGKVLRWMTSEPDFVEGREIWENSPKISAEGISNYADLRRLYAQREEFRKGNLGLLARNYEKSVFYQLDLADVAEQFCRFGLQKPDTLPDDAPLMQRIHNRMLRAQIEAGSQKPVGTHPGASYAPTKSEGGLKIELRTHQGASLQNSINSPLGEVEEATDEQAAFGLLQEGLLADLYERKSQPRLNVYSDQIVWGRSPVRIDIAGGWTDTPPYSLFAGGNVVNFAIELNGQPPLQVYVKPCREHHIVLRSIDMGAMEVVRTFDELQDFCKVGSPFSIPKAALALAGFLPAFAETVYPSLEAQLAAFGTGIELTLLSAIPAGSGLGTSSILASTVLGSLSDFCGLLWDKNEICRRTLALEQLLTTGGGWQDQYGGVLQGIKLLQTEPGFAQRPLVRWLPEHLFTQPEYRDCHLLYYTGITRTAKGILAEIVRSMFLNSSPHLALLEEMKAHALDMAEAVQLGDFTAFGTLVGKSWTQNKALDSGTNPPEVEAIIDKVRDYTLGYKLPGAGGGGYLYMVAKDPQAALRIREALTRRAPNPRARFVEMSLSDKGFQVSRS